MNGVIATRTCPPAAVSEQRASNEARTLSAARAPDPARISIARVRAARIDNARTLPPARYGVAIGDRRVEVSHGQLTLRILTPPQPLATYLHFHHGGWVFGSVWEQDERLTNIARSARARVVSVGYRLAPENPLPAAVDDGVAAADWVRAEYGYGPLLVGGESAGAHVALCTLLRLRDDGGVRDVRAVQLSYGMYDLSMTPSARAWGEHFLSISTSWLAWFYDQAAAEVPPDSRRVGWLSPLYADLAALPPTLLTVGTADPLVDDTLLLADALRGVSVDVELAVWPEGPHGLNVLPTAIGRAAENEIRRYLTSAAAAEHSATDRPGASTRSSTQ